MALDRESTDPAYLCGRLFAVLESIQLRSAGYNLNRTIKDSYFASACARPAVIFPRLIQLAQHHLNKLDYTQYYEAELAGLIDCLPQGFPARLSLSEQGKFIVGYYQQYQYSLQQRTAKKEEKGNDD